MRYQGMDDAITLAVRRNRTTREDFAKEVLGMSDGTLRSRCNGNTEFTLGEACKVADVTGWTLDQLADREPVTA